MHYLRRINFDIEVKSPAEFPKPEEVKYPISAICIYDNFTDHFYSLVLSTQHEFSGKVAMADNWDIYYLPEEKQIAVKFAKLIQYLDPDTMEGFYSRTFDFPYVINRFPLLGINSSVLSPIGYVAHKNNRITIGGRHTIDIIDADKKFKKRISYSLKNIAEEENLPVQKIEVDIIDIHNHPAELAKYNKVDVETVVGMDNKLGHIKRYVNRWNLSGLDSIDSAMSNSVVVDTVMLREAKKRGIVLPSKPERAEIQKMEDDDDEMDITGGMVFTPVIGIHDWVNDYDQSRFYPNLTLLMRMSPDNISPNGVFVSANGTRFIDNPNAFLPSIISQFFKERDRIQAEMKKISPEHPNYWKLHEEDENAKFLLNSVPGTFGMKGFRLYDPRIIDSITSSGQVLMKKGKAYLDSENKPVVAGDTDSLHSETNANNLEDAIKIGNETAKNLNSMFPVWAKEMFNIQDASSIRIIFEKVFRRIVYIPKDDGTPAKKRYFARLVYEKGKITDQIFIRGLDYRRSDTAKVSKNLQYDIFKKILYAEKMSDIKAELISFVQNVINAFEAQSISDIGLPFEFSKDLSEYGKPDKNGKTRGLDPEVRGALYSNEHLHTNFGNGSKVKLLYLKNIINTEKTEYPPTDVICFSEESQLPKIEIDYEKMIELTIRKKIERILIVADVNWKEIEGAKSMFDF
jgi:DNA polymerase I